MATGRFWTRLTDRVRGGGQGRGQGQCVCGHAHEAHEHYRAGTECALCDCPRYRRP